MCLRALDLHARLFQRLKQILHNLLGNAAKFTQDGSIHLSVCPDETESKVIFTVSDTGPGIPEEKMQSVFNAYDRVSIRKASHARAHKHTKTCTHARTRERARTHQHTCAHACTNAQERDRSACHRISYVAWTQDIKAIRCKCVHQRYVKSYEQKHTQTRNRNPHLRTCDIKRVAVEF